ncbi:MAG: hypothetical protein JXB26_01445 [Candidatus Aminicenantes bacterium]|nr:hypothetical protein [Candidatus Aminicenantes bacterium]
MRNLLIGSVFIILAAFSFGQKLQHETGAVNIEVPVRVFKGETFIDNLSIKDFKIYENGVLQKIEAVYLISKTNINKEESVLPADEARKTYTPQVNRHYVLVFEVLDYLPKMGEAIDHFFRNVMTAEDTLTLMTPRKSYNFKKDALKNLPRDAIVQQVIGLLKKDTTLANTEYKAMVKEIEQLYTQTGVFQWETGDWKNFIRDILSRLESYRFVDEKKLLAFSDFLKSKRGQKNVFLFFQKEMIPKYNPYMEILMTSMTNPEKPDAALDFLELTTFYRRDITFDVEKIKQYFSDSSIQTHFLYLTKTPEIGLDVERRETLSKSNVHYVEQSEDIFSAFSEVAKATGGFSSSSANTVSAFQKAVDASENYYLLYYSPKDYKEDGTFRNIEVRVKEGGYRVTHRAGYLAK